MKKAKTIILGAGIFLLIIVVAALAYSYLSEEYAPNTQGIQQRVEAPDFSVMDERGDEVKLSSFEGKPAIVNFWATWCGPCKTELPHFDSAYREYGDRIGFMMLNVDGGPETVDEAKRFVAQGGYSFPQYFDVGYQASTVYGISAIPVTLFIDAEGYVVASRIGMLSQEDLSAEIEKLLED